MSSILERDTDLALPSCTIVSASAGSGKTYTLTQRFIQLLLSDHVPHNGLRNILAITFTNKAANEMKRKVMAYLQAICLSDQEKLEEMAELVSMSKDRLQEKARVVLDEIYRNYSDLQIRTIDSFMSTVFRTSSFDFGFQPDVDILLDNRPLITQAFERLTREMNAKPEIKPVLRDLVKLITETRGAKPPFLWDPYEQILREVKRLYSRISSQTRPLVSGEGLKRGEEIKNDILSQIRNLREVARQSGLAIATKLQNDFTEIEAGRLDTVLGRVVKLSVVNKPKDLIEKKKHEKWGGRLSEELGKYNGLLTEATMWHARNGFKPYIDAIQLVQETLTRLKLERDEIFIDDVNQQLNRYLTAETVVDAYLMLGEQIYHYLIDEFQDTSGIQWANLKPLIENSLAQGGSLFVVGDTRQSIYAFRNADWRIMKRLRETDEFPSARRLVRPLTMNRRSQEEILRYTQHVFEVNVAGDEEYGEPAKLSGLDNVRQEVTDENRGKGVVEVQIVPWDEEKRNERTEILNLIADCTARNYQYRDIAILTPENDRVIDVSGWLNEASIDVLPFSSLDIRTRSIICELIALLRFLDSPIDDLSFASFLLGDIFAFHLSSHGKVTKTDLQRLIHTASHRKPYRVPLYSEFRQSYPDLWTKYFDELYRLVGYLPIYDLISEVYKVFRLFDVVPREEAALIKLLDVLKQFEGSDKNSLKDFLEFAGDEGETSNWQMAVPQDVNAVRIMTVHKAKGLEFKVVIVVLYDRDLRSERYFFKEEPEGIRLLKIGIKMAERVEYLGNVYEAQKQNDRVDTLNKLYVALTRAKDEMFVIGVEGSHELIPSRVLPYGDPQLRMKEPVKTKDDDNDRTLHPYHHNLRVTPEEIARERIGFLETKRGEFVHALLSRIEFIDSDPAATVDRIMAECTSMQPFGLDLTELRSSLLSFLEGTEAMDLLRRTPDRSVMREQEFSATDGALFRMDRLLIEPDLVTVIDFKTGRKEQGEGYRKQIQTYLGLLQDVFPGRRLKGLLAYIDQKLVEEVQ